ncbi:hypothetical protein QE152_g8561 [Popillia japonica]|uniref:Uncharacterized protein n=1 Tax=Popillia japonica TaxID=7064 RepID=A0AAW1MC79_POPJA
MRGDWSKPVSLHWLEPGLKENIAVMIADFELVNWLEAGLKDNIALMLDDFELDLKLESFQQNWLEAGLKDNIALMLDDFELDLKLESFQQLDFWASLALVLSLFRLSFGKQHLLLVLQAVSCG